MARNHSRFDKTSDLTPSQLKMFDMMYKDTSYTVSAVAERFGINASSVAKLARERGLILRVKRTKRGM